MTLRDGMRGRHLYTEATAAFEEASDEQEKLEQANDCETEADGHRSEPQNSTGIAGEVPAPDGGWGWVVLAATIVVLALTLAFPSTVGIFYTDLQDEFHASNSETSWVPSIMISALHAGGPFCSILVERFGCRGTVMLGGALSGFGMAASSFTRTIMELYITAGIITGLGFCFSYQPAVAILGHYFHRRRPFANAMSSTGTAFGLCILPFLGNYLHTELGWRGSFLVFGAVLLNCCVCGAVMRPLASQRRHGQVLKNYTHPQQEGVMERMRTICGCLRSTLTKHMAFDQFCNNSRYRVYAIGITWMMLGFVVPLVFLVPYATENGMDPSQAAFLLSILGIVSIAVRPVVGVIFNMHWFKGRHVYVFASALMINGLSNNICCIGPSFSVLLSYVLVYGLSMSVVGSLMFTVLMDEVEMSNFPSALGLLAVMESVTLLIGPPLAGILIDRMGQYSPLFFACSVVVSSSSVFLIVSFYWLDKRDRKALQQVHQITPPVPASPAANAAAGCDYSSVRKDGDENKG